MGISDKAIFIFVLIFLMALTGNVFGWICPSQMSKIYAREGEDAVLHFQANVTSKGRLVSYSIRFFTAANLFTVSYFNDNIFGSPSINGGTFVGNTTTGDLSIRISPIELDDIGVYRLQRINSGQITVVQCNTLFLLGKPSKPSISSNKNPSVGESVTLSCKSVSTTVPSNHSLSLAYTWKLNGTVLRMGSKYKISTETLTVSGLVRLDSSSIFTCTATETTENGYSSDLSKEFTINVLYGPDNMRLIPDNVTYTKAEFTTLSHITCYAECNPNCLFNWMKTSPNKYQVNDSASLNLETLTREESGEYTCSASRDESFVKTKILTINITYGPENITLEPEVTELILNEGAAIQDITCSADCNPPCAYVWKKSGSSTEVESKTVLSLGISQRDDSASYTCIATSQESYHSISKQLNVFVRYGPDGCDTNIQSPYKVLEGVSSSNITCRADCYPSCSCQWTNTTSGEIVGQHGTLDLGNTTRHQTGEYICNCKNDAQQLVKSARTSLQIVVQYVPASPKEFRYMYGYPIPTFAWDSSYNGEYELIYVIQISEENSNTWTNKSFVSEGDTQYLNNNGTYIVTVPNISPGVYNVRLKSVNSVGSSEPVYLYSSIYVKGDSTSPSSQNTAVLPVGLVLGAVNIGIGAYAIYITIAFRRMLASKGKQENQEHDQRQELSTYTNFDDQSDRDGMKRESTSGQDDVNQYMSLDKQSSAPDTTYEALQTV